MARPRVDFPQPDSPTTLKRFPFIDHKADIINGVQHAPRCFKIFFSD